jgi:hypothetical protein
VVLQISFKVPGATCSQQVAFCFRRNFGDRKQRVRRQSNNVPDKRAGQTSEWVQTRARRVFHLLFIIFSSYNNIWLQCLEKQRDAFFQPFKHITATNFHPFELQPTHTTFHSKPSEGDILEYNHEPILLQAHANSRITKSKSFFGRFFRYPPNASLPSAQSLKRWPI